MIIIASGLSPILAVITTSIVSSSLSSAVSSIAAPADSYGMRAGLNSTAPYSDGGGSGKITKKSDVRNDF